MAFFQNHFWGEKSSGFDVLYHNMKHGQLATKELAEFVRERAAVEETYSKSMCKLSKIASNGSPQGTFAPLWDVFRVSSDKLALCHLELMRKMNDLIRDINKYGEEQGKTHRKTKEEVVGTLEAVQGLQVHSAQLQKAREAYHSRCGEVERLRKEAAPQKEVEKAELKSKKAAEALAVSIEKYNRVGAEFQQKMSDSAQKFQDIEEAHLRQMKLLIKGYSHSIEDTHVQVGQVHEEFKQNVENIGTDNLLQKFAEQKGTGKERPAVVGFEEYMPGLVVDGGKKSRGKAFRIPGLGKRDKEPDSSDSAVMEALNSPLDVDEEGFVIRADDDQNGCADGKDGHFYSSDSDFDDEEPKKFHIQIRPVASGRHCPAAAEKELKATVGALTLPPNRAAPVKRQLSRASSTTGGHSEGDGEAASHRDGEPEGLRRSTSSPNHSRLSSTASGSDSLFGPPLDSAFRSRSLAGREPLREYGAFSSDSSSPENVEDSGLDSPSHQPLGPSPEPVGWVAWPHSAPHSKEAAQQSLGRPADPFLSAFRDPSPGQGPQDEPQEAWPAPSHSPWGPPDPPAARLPAFAQSAPPPAAPWGGVPEGDPFLAAFEKTVNAETAPSPNAWPAPTREGRGPREGRAEPFSVSLGDNKTLPLPSSSSSSSRTSSNHRGRERRRDRSMPPPTTSDDPFAITMIGSPTHQSSLAPPAPSSRLAASASAGCLSVAPPQKELLSWNSVHNPFSDGPPPAPPSQEEGGRGRGAERRKHRSSDGEPRRNAPPLTRHSGPQEDLCFSTDKDQDCLELSGPPAAGRVPQQGGGHTHNTFILSPAATNGPPSVFRQDSAELLAAAPPRPSRSKRPPGRAPGSERSRSLCSSPLPDPSPPSSSSSSPSEWGSQAREEWGSQAREEWGSQAREEWGSKNRDVSPLPYLHQEHPPRHLHLSRGPSPISLSPQDAWPVAAAITEYINAYFKGGQHNRCLVKITGDLTMSFPAGFTRIFTANPNTPVLSFRLVNISRVDHFLPNQKLLYSDPSQSDPDSRDLWFNMPALEQHLKREAELNPGASYYNVGLLKYQVSSQDPGRAPLLLSAECQRSGTVTRVSLDYHCCPATAPSTQLNAVQVLLGLEPGDTDLQCQPPATWNAEERRLLWKLSTLSPTNHSKGSGTLCASWQCLEVPRRPPPTLAVQFVGSGASLSGMDVELVGGRYRMSLVKKRFATGKYMAGCTL